ncbi:unnamed protein product [Lactuca saligna]|uniref:GBF-interacting protein 1 N-terminal domain-containing protein n=1 Tax=Lactuca saligna TaxID=75948 RepID=A0AA36E1X6_LACSI|nr:unnamed protein product [Lactuca saligna]
MGSRGGGGSNGGGSHGIPSASRRMVQSLKEIVNGVPEAEIYSTLKDCNMDPNEAVNRLLSQDPFHEVKSKREKKKEFKDSTEPRTRGGGGGTSNRGGRSGTDRYGGRGGSNHFSSSESGGLHGRPTYKRENDTSSFTSSTTSASKVAPRNTSWNPPSFSASDNASVSVSVSQPSSGYQSAWSGAPGQKSMADIVKMGRPQNNQPPPQPQTTTHNHAPPPPPTVSDNHASSPDNEWPSIEQPQPVNLHPITDSTTNSDQSNKQLLGHETNEVEVQDESSSEDQNEDYENENENESHGGNLDIPLEEEEDDDDAPVPISSVTANIHEENHMDPAPPQEEDDDDVPSVVIPDHLQVHTADCSHLSFGSFGANMNQGYSGHFTSTADAEPEPVTSSVEHSETTNLEYYEDRSRTGGNTESYDLASASQTALKQEDHHHHHHDHDQEVTRGNEYGFPPTTNTHTFDFPQSQISTPFMNAMSANGHPNPVRESDLSSYSQFSLSVSQSMPSRYANSASPINDPTVSMAEALKNVGLTSPPPSSSSSQPAQSQHTPVGAGAVPQHLAMHPYSQHNLPLGGHFTNMNMNMNMNMMSYPYLPQSYTYMPSGFQPNTYHQQLAAAILPHYKNNLSTQSPSLPSGYTSSGNYEDVLNAHYKELQQNEWARGGGSRSAVPANAYYSLQSQNHQQQPQPQPQPPSGFRQPSQGYGGAGVNYPDFIQSQVAGVSQEQQLQLQLQLQQQQQQQQNPREGGGSQQKLQSQQQLWQNGY